MELIPPRLFCIGTHHKTGTLWMRSVFNRLAALIGLDLTVIYPASGAHLIPDSRRAFLANWSSAFPPDLLARPDARILHLIRDPRDVLLSGLRYHLTSDHAGEEALHRWRDDLGGRSYQQHLRTLGTAEARLLFEMRGRHAETLDAMLAWSYDASNTVEARYETLMTDAEGRVFGAHLRDLGLPEPEVALGVETFRERSLFGGLSRPVAVRDRVASHVADGSVAQWRTQLPRAIAEAYADAHGDALVALGYESHPTDWVREVRDAA